MTVEDKIKLDRITQKYLRECLLYDPDEGAFTWRNRPLYHFKDEDTMKRINYKMAGRPAGTYSKAENMTYLQIDGKKFRANKLAVIHRVGQIGKKLIICINGDGADIRIANLKAVDSDKKRSCRPWIHGPTRSTGIKLTKSGKYYARLFVDGKTIQVGTRATKEEAIELRNQAVKDYGIIKQKRRVAVTS